MPISNKKIIEILIEREYLSENDYKKAQTFAADKSIDNLTALYNLGLLNKEVQGIAIAEYFDIEHWDINFRRPNVSLLKEMSPEAARKYHLLMVEETDDSILVVCDDPENKDMLMKWLSEELGKKIDFAYSTTEDIVSLFKYLDEGLNEQIIEIYERKDKDVIIQIIDAIFQAGSFQNATDIHFEPDEKETLIRFRIDGQLATMAIINNDIYEAISNKIKILAKLRIDIHEKPQDGAIRYKVEDRALDIRVSLTPILNGEKIVLRILGSHVGGLSLNNLGIENDHLQTILEASSKNIGMIIVGGPTGSGKTTTLYGVLKHIQSQKVNITTVEDPVEYKITGINQIQVNPEKEVTFARGLRSILRQDPDVILVGEIRDVETAEIATNAALTGHLVLSTFHANNASAVVPRLVEMGIEPYMASSTITLIISQRLIRKNCKVCIASETHKVKDFKGIAPDFHEHYEAGIEEVTTYSGKGCPSCGHTGYSGRTAIYEVMIVDKEMRKLINTQPSADDIENLAIKKGFKKFRWDALEKVKSGLTTLEEANRVAPMDV